jgi:hypothetical protein
MDAEVQRAVEEFQRATQNFAQVMSSMSGSVQQAAAGSSSLASASSSASSSVSRLGSDAKYAGTELVSAASDGSAAMQGYNRALAQTTKLLQNLLGPIGPAVGALGGALQTAVAQGDRYAKVYGNLSQNGLLLNDSMESVAAAGKQAGYAIGANQEQAQKFSDILQRSSGDLALFSKGTARARDTFVNAAKGIEGNREGLMRLGIGFDEATEGIGQYIKLQAMSGNVQNQTAESISRGTVGYLRNLNELSQLTGQSRAEIAKTQEEALRNARFNAKIIELQKQGPEGEAAAKRLMNTYTLLAAQSKEAADGFADLSTGMVSTENATKLQLSTNGQALQVSQDVINGQKSSIEGFQVMARAAGENAEKQNKLTQAIGDVPGFVKFNEQVRLGAAGVKDSVALEKELAALNAKTEADAGKGMNQQVQFQLKQRDLNLELQDAINKIIPTAQAAALALQKVAVALVPGLTDIIGEGIRTVERFVNLGGANRNPAGAAPNNNQNNAASSRGNASGAAPNNNQNNAASSRGNASGAAPRSASGNNAPVTGPAPATGGLTDQQRAQLEGLSIKKGALADGAPLSQKIIDAARSIQESFPGAKFTSFNDPVKGRSANSAHNTGNAVDIVVPAAQVESLKELLNSIGAKKVINEMRAPANKSAAGSWGPHIHAEFANGGIARGPRSGFPALLHGTEAVVPLPDGKTIPVRNDGNTEMVNAIKDLKNSMNPAPNMSDQSAVAVLQDILRVQRDQGDTLNKILLNARA